jgi:hypothetical protein
VAIEDDRDRKNQADEEAASVDLLMASVTCVCAMFFVIRVVMMMPGIMMPGMCGFVGM